MPKNVRINYVSDLHLEFEPTYKQRNKAKADILALAGDIVPLKYMRESSGLYSRYIEFFRVISEEYDHCVWIPGNHEYYGGTDISSDILEIVSESIPYNCHIINNETINLSGLNIFGATMWTDMDKHNPLAILTASQVMNDFKAIKDSKNQGYRFTAQSWLRENSKSLTELKLALSKHDNLLVMTHHSPSRRSIHKKYANDPSNCYYHSEYDNLLEADNLLAYIHGHTHDTFQYDKVYCNPKGYHDENKNFDPNAFIDLTI